MQNVSKQKQNIKDDNLDKPPIRFLEFDDKWNIIKIKDISSSITKGTTPNSYSDSGINFIKVESIVNNKINNINAWIDENTHKNELNRSILKENDLLFSIAGSLGRTTIINKNILPANTNQALAIIRLNEDYNINIEFIQTRLNCQDIDKYIFQNLAVGAQPNLNLKQVGNIKISIPSLEEQNKIQNFINLIDKKIELLEKKHKNKVIFKNEFFNNYVSKLQNNDCNKFKLDKFITIHNKRNKNNDNIPVLSINNKLGFISQEEQFEDRNVASSDTKNYKIVEKGDFAYNPARINVGSIARLTNFDKGIISPMYIVFKTDSTIINPVFFENYIFTNYFKLEILKRLEGSVRLILSADSLKNIEILVPNLNEQQKISEFLELLSKDIYLSEINLKKLKEFKKGLLQKMFV